MRAKVTKQGVLIPRKHFKGIRQVEIRRARNGILVVPIADDPILQLGRRPVSSVKDASESHDRYVYPE